MTDHRVGITRVRILGLLSLAVLPVTLVVVLSNLSAAGPLKRR